MRIKQESIEFIPIQFELQFKSEAELFWEIMRYAASGGKEPLSERARAQAASLSDWFSQEAKL